jgi:hypothetical protein
MDCIEHHFAALHAAMADFDANLLTVMSPCEDLVGLKAAHGGLDVDTIIGRILKKQLLQLKSDDPTMNKRADDFPLQMPSPAGAPGSESGQ